MTPARRRGVVISLSLVVALFVIAMITQSVFVLIAYGVAYLSAGAFYFAGAVAKKPDRILSAEKLSRKELEAAQRQQRLQEIRAHQFALASVPYPDRRYLNLACDLLVQYKWLRRYLLRDIARRSTNIEVTLEFLPYAYRVRVPITHVVDSLQIYESSDPCKKPSVSFPTAQVNSDGRITNYGQVALLHGCKYGFPAWKDEQELLQEQDWEWQIPPNLNPF
jgi:hypothetical protein